MDKNLVEVDITINTEEAEDIKKVNTIIVEEGTDNKITEAQVPKPKPTLAVNKLRTTVSRTRDTTIVDKAVVTNGKATVEDNSMEEQLGQANEIGHATPASYLFNLKMNFFNINKPLMAKNIAAQVLLVTMLLLPEIIIKITKPLEYTGVVAMRIIIAIT